jgi:cell division protein FtsL
MFGVLSGRSGYLMAPHDNGVNSGRAARVRTFLVGSAKDRGGLLVREAIMTTALTEQTEPISRFGIFDSTGTVDYQQIGERLGIEAALIELVDPAEQALDVIDPVDFAIAYGAAVAHADKTQTASFRDDFMPYQGKKIKMEKALKYFSISITVLLFAVGLYFQTRLFSVNGYQAKVREKFAEDYAVAMSNIKLPDNLPIKQAVARLSKVKSRLEKGGPNLTSDENSVESKLAIVLNAFNKSAKQTKLNITKVSIAARSITISGWTSSIENTRKFFSTVRQSGLNIDEENVDPTEPGKNKFNITVALKK